MTNVVSSVTLAVDSSQVKSANTALDGFAASGTKAQTAASGLERSASGAVAGINATAAAAKSAAAAQKQLAAEAKSAASALRQAELSARKASNISAQQTAQLGFQLQDFFIQVQAGQSPLTAFIQQGSQLSGVYGGAGNAFRAVTGLITPMVAAISAGVAAVGALSFGFLSGESQSNAFAKSLVLTGNSAGLTEGRFLSLSAAISDSTKTTIGATKETLQALVASGRFSGETLAEAGRSAQLLSKVTGQATDEIVKDFTRAADAPSRFAESLNRQYNLLTQAQIEAIKTAEDQGRAQDALSIIFKTLNVRLEDASKNVGTLERAYNALTGAASRAKDALSGVGRDLTVDKAIEETASRLVQAKLQLERVGRPGAGLIDKLIGAGSAEKVAELEALLTKLRESKQLAEKGAAADAASAQQQAAKRQVGELLSASLGKQQKLTKELSDATVILDRAQASQTEREKVLSAIRAKYDGDGSKTRKATVEAEVSGIENALKRETGAYRNAESILDALRQAGKVKDADFYQSKLKFIDITSAAQVAALQAENEELNKQRLAGADLIARNTKVADNISEIARIKADSAAKGLVLGIQESAAVEALARGYDEAQRAAQSYLDTLTKGQASELQGLGLGSVERSREQARQQIRDRYEAQRQQLEAQRRSGQIDKQRYDAELQALEEFKAKALVSYEDYVNKRIALEGDFSVGASRALADYQQSAADVAAQSEAAFTSAFKGAEDALVQFATTGKLNVKSLVQSVIADLARIQIRQGLSQLLGLFGPGFAAFDTNGIGTPETLGINPQGRRAIGGPVASNSTYRVLEKGQPEMLTSGGKSYLMTGAQGGQVTPVTASDAAPVININVAGDATAQTVRLIAAQVQQAIARERRQRAYAGA